MKKRKSFGHFANAAAQLAGKPQTFLAAVFLILLWAVCGPIFHYSTTWQLMINTGTTIVTFLMVFIIQNAQNREGRAIQVKLDELIRAIEGAHNVLLDLEDLTEEELDTIHKRYYKLAKRARKAIKNGEADTDQPLMDFQKSL